MYFKLFSFMAIIILILSGCGISPQYQVISKTATATQEIIYMDEATPEASPSTHIQNFPDFNPTYIPFSIPILAVSLANDDGSDRSGTRTEQVIRWVDEANLIFAQASLRFIFDPSTDVMEINNSLLNNIIGNSDPKWMDAVNEGKKIALENTGKVVVFFRNPPLAGDVGSWEEDFMLMPSQPPDVCGHPDDSYLAHQIGHYLGLENTFPELFNSIAEAEKAYEKSGFSAAFFDGDGLLDTPPDVYINQQGFRCGDKLSIKISNADFSLTRGNLMSYYEPRSQLSPLQVQRVRYILALRSRNGSLIPSNQTDIPVFQFEELPLPYKIWCEPQVKDMSEYYAGGWSGGKFVNIPGGYGSICKYSFTVPETGSYEMGLYATKMPEYGIVEISMDDWIINDGLDLYSPFPLPTGNVTLGTFYLEEGSHSLSFEVVRKSLDSLNYNFGLDALSIQLKDQ